MPEGQDIITAIAVEVAKEISQQTYHDGISPGMRETGSILEDIAKTLHLALAPLQWTAALQDRYRSFLDASVRRIPPERRISPAPQILGPVIEAIKYEDPGSFIEDMFCELLSRSMDKDLADEAHPAFPTIIKQLSPDEGKLLETIFLADPPYKTRSKHPTNTFGPGEIEFDNLPTSQLRFPGNANIYVEHLMQLGLLSLEEKDEREAVMDPGGLQIGVGWHITRRYCLTGFGNLLARAAFPHA